ncbi:MAG: serine/threonine protein kinase, partial [Nannocystaceae bacterium]|nr:serine/threonine protein kinase [Nannocystaceae bacterium]
MGDSLNRDSMKDSVGDSPETPLSFPPWLAQAAAAPPIPLEPPDAELLPAGTEIGTHYEIEGLLGVGGMGVVYRAFDLSLARSVALKLHRSEKGQAQERLLREAKVMARLSHPNVLAVHEVGTWQGHVYLAAELVEGTTAREWQKQGHAWQDVVRLYIEVGQGVAAAHAVGLVHRDLKPDNVLVGDDGRVRVADFGLARLAGPATQSESTASLSTARSDISLADITRTGSIVGTPAYMAPEQFMGEELDGRADQFAYCISLFEALYGKRPFSGVSAAALAAAIGRGPVRPIGHARIPRRLWRAIARGLRPEPADRFGGMDELLGELRATLRRGRIGYWGLAAGAATVAALGWTGGETASVCERAGDAIHGVWGDERRVALAALYAADGDVRSDWPLYERMLDRYADDWSEASMAVCRDAATTLETTRAGAAECLNGGRLEFDALL